MKILFLLLIILSLTVNASEEDCPDVFVPDVLDTTSLAPLLTVGDKIKQDFKRRPLNLKGYHLALNFETNFEAPFVGNEPYWGRIFFNDNSPSEVSYRDELIAERHYKEEKANPKSFWKSDYKISDINSAKGLPLIDAGGAEVSVKSVGAAFTTKNGGRLNLKVKAPKTSQLNLIMDVRRNGNQVSKTLMLGNKQVPFDSFKINADSNVFGISILNGIRDVQFYKNGKLVHTITP